MRDEALTSEAVKLGASSLSDPDAPDDAIIVTADRYWSTPRQCWKTQFIAWDRTLPGRPAFYSISFHDADLSPKSWQTYCLSAVRKLVSRRRRT